MGEIKYITPCCNKDFTDTGSLGPIFMNPYNEKVQCHNCGEVFVRAKQLTEARELIREVVELIPTCTGDMYLTDYAERAQKFLEGGEIINLVLYHQEKDKIQLYKTGVPYYQKGYWLGEPFVVWSTLEIALSRGWEVIGEL